MSGRTPFPKKNVINYKSIRTQGRKIVCPYCGNEEIFLEVAEKVTISTHYIQNKDGSFSPLADDTEIKGEIRFYCGQCHADLTSFHKKFLEMLF